MGPGVRRGDVGWWAMCWDCPSTGSGRTAVDFAPTNAADTAFAAELSQTTGGENLKSEELGDFLRRLLKADLQPDNTRLTTVSLWDNWLFLLLFVTIMTVEWFLRKTRGLV